MVKIRYDGPIGTHLVVSPLRRVPTYGLHTRGDIFEVHEQDQQAAPNVFRLVEVKKVQTEPAVNDLTEVVILPTAPPEPEVKLAPVAKPPVKKKVAKKKR